MEVTILNPSSYSALPCKGRVEGSRNTLPGRQLVELQPLISPESNDLTTLTCHPTWIIVIKKSLEYIIVKLS